MCYVPRAESSKGVFRTMSYYQEHRETLLAKQLEYYQKNKKKRKAYQNKYNREHREIVLRNAAEYRETHKEYTKKYNHEYYLRVIKPKRQLDKKV